MLNEKKIDFIVCVNDDLYFNECTFYISHLTVPKGYETEIISIRDADSMCSAYNAGMKESDARYKVYLHQDVFIRNINFLSDILSIFERDSSIGMIGMIGGNNMPVMGTWNTGLVDVRNPAVAYYLCGKREWNGFDVEVEAVDGILIATQYDLPWREDLFTHFDFYDISQSFEMRKAGYKVIVPYQREPWVIHDCGFAKLKYYNDERHICQKNYPEFFCSDNGAEFIYDEEWNSLNSVLASKIKELISIGRWYDVKKILNSYENIDRKTKRPDSDMTRLGVIDEIYEEEHRASLQKYFFKSGMTYKQVYEKYIYTRFLIRRMELGMKEETYQSLIRNLLDEQISLPVLFVYIIHSVHYREELIQKLIDFYKSAGNDAYINVLKKFGNITLKNYPPTVYESN